MNITFDEFVKGIKVAAERWGEFFDEEETETTELQFIILEVDENQES